MFQDAYSISAAGPADMPSTFNRRGLTSWASTPRRWRISRFVPETGTVYVAIIDKA